MKKTYSLIVLFSIILSGCSLLGDDATHLAYTLKRGARQLIWSSKTKVSVSYEPLKGINQTYFVEINSTIPSSNPDSIQYGGGIRVGVQNTETFTSYHQRFVVVPIRLYIDKKDSATVIVLKKNGKKIEVAGLY